MRVISKSKLRNYWECHRQAEIPLVEWYFKMKNIAPLNIQQLRSTFNSVDPVGGYSIFNIGGNNFRLITAIHYNAQRCYVREIWTHNQYSKRINQDKLSRGEL
jgi:mRNA interferase HigB